jgi:hypothetical protein
MKQLISIIAILLWASSAWGGTQAPRKLVTAAAGGAAYYIGYTTDTETSTSPSATPNNITYVSGIDSRVILRKLVIPAGSTITNIWYRFGDSADNTALQVVVYAYVSDTEGGGRLASANITPSLNSWVRSSTLSGTQTYFSSDTTVFVGLTFTSASTSFTVTRESTGSDYFYKTATYNPSTLGAVSSASYNLAVVLEQTR